MTKNQVYEAVENTFDSLSGYDISSEYHQALKDFREQMIYFLEREDIY